MRNNNLVSVSVVTELTGQSSTLRYIVRLRVAYLLLIRSILMVDREHVIVVFQKV